MAIEILQNDYSLEHQRQLVAEALPELEAFIIIGHDNLTSDAEGEDEMLTVSRKNVQKLYSDYCAERDNEEPGSNRSSLGGRIAMLQELFGSKCLPDEVGVAENATTSSVDRPEANVDSLGSNVDSLDGNVDSLEPKPAEPKFKPNDKVIFENVVCTIMQVCYEDSTYSLMKDKTGAFVAWIAESDLEPYTEPGERRRIMNNEVKISFHVARIPCPEEFYSGVSAAYEAYDVVIPIELIPKQLLEVIQSNGDNKQITSIAIHKEA